MNCQDVQEILTSLDQRKSTDGEIPSLENPQREWVISP